MFLLKREDVLGQTNVCLHAYGRSFLYMERRCKIWNIYPGFYSACNYDEWNQLLGSKRFIPKVLLLWLR